MSTPAALKHVDVLVLVILALVGLEAAAHADLPAIQPRICTGRLDYDDGPVWGNPPIEGCPPGFAVSSLNGIGGPRGGPASRIFIFENCCPLPAPDILSEETVQTFDICPDDYVATRADGYYRHFETGAELTEARKNGKFQLRCTKLNTERYQLGPPATGWYFGFGSNFWRQKFSIFHEEIPPALRYGFGRYSRYLWTNQGCFGLPFGALLTGKTGKNCADLLFRALQFRGLPGDPPAGTSVPMYPECDYIEDPLGAEPKCSRFMSDEASAE